MTDEELAAYLGILADHPKKAAVIAGLSADKRAVFERMASLEIEIDLWQAGLAPKPTGVLLDMERVVFEEDREECAICASWPAPHRGERGERLCTRCYARSP